MTSPVAATFPGALTFLASTHVGIGLITFVGAFLLFLYLRPPSMLVNTMEGPKINWIVLSIVSLLIALVVHIYPIFIRTLAT